ncbi:MAG: hydratase [Proteobacteria bacterium]|nr:hydratase [Pseudomonadota bacterium]
MPSKTEQTSAFLVDLWKKQARCAGLPAEIQPASRAEAYAAQALMEGQSAKPLSGWKIAATSLAGQKHIGVSGPLAGRYIAERVVSSGDRVPFGRNHMKVAEVEFAFRMAQDLPPRAKAYSEDEVFAAVGTLHPSIEIPDSRFDHFEKVGAEALIADNACADWLAIGQAAPDIWRGMDLAAFSPTGSVVGKGEWKGLGINVLGSPRIAMTWIANELSAIGVTLRKGEIVTTGTCLVPMAIAAGDHVVADYGPLGRIELHIGA